MNKNQKNAFVYGLLALGFLFLFAGFLTQLSGALALLLAVASWLAAGGAKRYLGMKQ